MADREKVIKGLAEISEYARAKADIAGIGKGKEVFDSWYRAAEDALALLREQEAVEPTIGGWISVKDRLPEKSGTYLCYQSEAARICALNTVRWSEVRGWMGKEVGSRIEGITHWMPLPEPPKGGDNETD